MTDIMIDIETLGIKSGSIVVSVGACRFNRKTGEIGPEFYRVIDIEDSASRGLTVEAGTALWWLKQSDEARSVFKSSAVNLIDAVRDFSDWMRIVSPPNTPIWAQGDMDFQVWGAAIDACGITRPWEFWSQRDTRSVYDVCGFDTWSIERDGTYHNALDDARHQVKCLHAALKSTGLAQ